MDKDMNPLISVIIPNRNGSAFIGKCLEAAFSSRHNSYEVLVVDDCSDDDSVAIIQKFPCRLIRLRQHGGASGARNIGAEESRGKILFFTDADCLLLPDTLSLAEKTLSVQGPGTIVGGTYTNEPQDADFFSRFQSTFIRYSETKRPENPDYIASHAMALYAETFRESGGFPGDFLPIIEDVEFSHRLKRSGCRLAVNPEIEVRHVFNFSFARSLRNAVRKAFYWTLYSLRNRDVFVDSGTASLELKADVASLFLSLLLMASAGVTHNAYLLLPLPLIMGGNIFISRRLLKAFRRAGTGMFAFRAYLYYTLLYPMAVGAGAFWGMRRYFFR
jgi:glycosyltransferase involved in cell wall biosynthesis